MCKKVLHICGMDASHSDVSEWIDVGFKFCPWCGQQLLLNKEEIKSKPIYTITVIYPECRRCVGFTYNEKDAIDLVLQNDSDIYETNGEYVVIETVNEGLYPIPDERWFKWIGDYKSGKYTECEKPLCHAICFSIG